MCYRNSESEQDGVTVTVQTRIPQMLVSNLDLDTDCSEGFQGFPQTFQANVRMGAEITQLALLSQVPSNSSFM
jgi:hypothetical protein